MQKVDDEHFQVRVDVVYVVPYDVIYELNRRKIGGQEDGS